MAAGQLTQAFRQLFRVAFPLDEPERTDGQLLEAFLRRDQAAFAALVHRHGPMVWSVCRRLLADYQDAEDAFQATFLVLVRRAGSVVPRDMVGNWLHGVARQTALKARAMAARRKSREKQLPDLPHAEAETEAGDDWREVLDRELGGLPERYRAPIVLCDLGGRTRKEAARQLGWAEGTVASRLVRGRTLLARRLTRRGLTLSVGAMAGLLAEGSASAVPVGLTVTTIRAAGLLATGVSIGVIPANVMGLTEGVVRMMVWTKVKTLAGVVLAVTAVGLSSVGFVYSTRASQQVNPVGDFQPALEDARQELAERSEAADCGPKDDGKREKLVGSDKEATKQLQVADFTSVQVRVPLHVKVTKGSFAVSVTGDDNLIEHVQAEKKGSALVVSFDAKHTSWQTKKQLRVDVAMPALEAVELSGAANASVEGFSGGKSFRAKLGGACKLDGSVDADEVKLEASGACRIGLKGSATTGTLSASGASRLELAEFSLDSAKVSLSGACNATVKAKEKLDYSLSGACRLHYDGNPKIGEAHASGASSASHARR